jgi:hypothetical protein
MANGIELGARHPLPPPPQEENQNKPAEKGIQDKVLDFMCEGNAKSLLAAIGMIALGIIGYTYILPNLMHIDVMSGNLGYASGTAAIIPGLLMVGGVFTIVHAILKRSDPKVAVICEFIKQIMMILAAIGMVVAGSMIFAQTIHNGQYAYGPNLLSMEIALGGLANLAGYFKPLF